MPYPGVPPSKTKEMERCVSQIMADPKFKPMRGKDKKSSAIAICHASIMGKEGGEYHMSDNLEKAVWTTAYVNTLPDSSFAYISPGGKKDKEGKTIPRSLRHLPYKDKNGKPDAAHVRNALARLNQTDIPASAKASAHRKLVAAAKSLGIEVSEGKKIDVGKGGEENMAKVQKDVKVEVEDSEVKKQDPAEEAKEEVAVDESPKEEVVAEEEEKVEEKPEEVKEEVPVEGEEEKEPEAEKPAEEPSEEKPAEESVEGEKVEDYSENTVLKILDKINKLEELLRKQDEPVEEVKEEEKPVEVPEESKPEEVVEEPKVEEEPKEEAPEEAPKEEVPSEVPAEESKVAVDFGNNFQKIETQVSDLSKKFEDLESRLKAVEEQPLPTKVFSPVAVRKGDSFDTKKTEELGKINARLKELEDLKASNIKKYQDERKWEEAFELLGKRDLLVLG